jgi:hypothetical protein
VSKYQAKITYLPLLRNGSILWSWEARIFSAADKYDHPSTIISSENLQLSKGAAMGSARHCARQYIEALTQDNQETLEFDV